MVDNMYLNSEFNPCTVLSPGDSSTRLPPSTGGWSSGGEEYQNVPSMHGNSIQHYGMQADEGTNSMNNKYDRCFNQETIYMQKFSLFVL